MTKRRSAKKSGPSGRGRGVRNPEAIDERRAEYETYIRDGMARYLWVSAFADWAEGAELIQEQDGPEASGTSGVEWDDVAPETPDAAVKAADDLVALFVVSEQLSGKTPMTELFEQAMFIDQGEPWEFGDEVKLAKWDSKTRAIKWVTGTHEDDGLPLAFEFGSMMAAEALGQGVSWADDHNVKDDRGNEFDPSVPSFECIYSGSDLSWSGVTRGAGGREGKHGLEDAPAWVRIGGDDGGGQQTVQIGRITVVNPQDSDTWSHTHRYVLWFGQHAPRYLMAYADHLQTALDTCVDWLEDQNLPGYFVDDEVNEEHARLVAEGEDSDDAWEEATADTTTAGNHGHYLNSEDWGVAAEDPTDAELRVIGRVDELRAERAAQADFDRRMAERRRPKIWVNHMSAADAQSLLTYDVENSLRLVPREGQGNATGAAFGATSAELDLPYAIQYLLSNGPLEPRWNTGQAAPTFVPRTWYLGPSSGGDRLTYVLDNFTHEQQRAVYDAVIAANAKAPRVRSSLPPPGEFRIAISFETIHMFDSEEGEDPVVSTGWINEEGVVADDIEDAVRMLRHEGPLEASSSAFHPGIWYTQSDDDINYQTGEHTRRSFHLRGFSEQQQRMVYDDLRRLKVIR